MTLYELKQKIHFHVHEWSVWEYTNKHYWSHAVTMFRHCSHCYQDEYKLIELNCPHYKIRGEYCHWCKPYQKEWEKRLKSMIFEGVLDDERHLCYNSYMKKTQPKIFFEANTERNKELYKFVLAGHSFAEAGEKFEISKARAYDLYRRFEKKIQKVS